MKKRSVIVALVLGAMVIFAIVNYRIQVDAFRDGYAQFVVKQERQLKSIIDLSKAMGKVGLWDDLRDRLEDFRQGQFIDFYILQYKGQPVWWSSHTGKLEDVQKPYEILNQPIRNETEGENAIYQTTPFDKDFKLTVGFIRDREAYVSTAMRKNRAFNLQEWVFFGVVVFVVSVWALRDLLLMAFRMSRGDTSGFFQINAKSFESDLLARGIGGYVETVKNLGLTNEMLGRQVLPALKKEILSGRTPPYSFGCTLVRVDINNFTDIFNKFDSRQFMATINEFFIEVSHVVSRYDGLILEFVGDEVIFYFKDDASPSSPRTAMSALRDIGKVAEDFNRRMTSERGYGFTIKSAFAQGTLHFGPLVDGFSFAGGILIETVRILSIVSEKKQNSIFFDARHERDLTPIVHSSEAGLFHLKGFEGDRRMLIYDSHRSIDEILSQMTATATNVLLSYRSDRDLGEIVNWLKESASDEPLQLAVLKTLRSFRVTRVSQSLIESVVGWLEELTQAEKAPHLATSALAWLPQLIPLDQMNEKIEERLAHLKKHSNLRFRATLIEVLSHFGSMSLLETKEFLPERDPAWRRVRINMLVQRGTIKIDKKLVKELRQLLKSSDELTQAGAVYAIGEIGCAHLKRDRVYLVTRVDFVELLDEVSKMRHSLSEPVREQALKALDKIPQHEWNHGPAANKKVA